jgi:hypothetical protein
MSHPNEIELGGVELADESYEVARLWVTHEAGSGILVDARVLEDPRQFGYLIADTIRHAAFAYSQVWKLDQDEAAKVITAGMAEELERLMSKDISSTDGSAT